MITLRYKGFFGNQLFQYAVARLLAERLGYGLRSYRKPWCHLDFDPRDLFPSMRERLQPRQNSLDSVLPSTMTTLRRAAARVSGGHWCNVPRRYRGQSIDIERVVAERSPQILLSGYFENYANIRSYKQEVRALYRFARPSPQRRTDDWVIHLRFDSPKEVRRWSGTGDGVPLERDLALRDYYVRLLDHLAIGRLHIVTNRPDHPYLDRLATFRPVVVSSSTQDDFFALASFPNIVMAPSAFSWWAAWLSGARRVVFPPFRFWRHPHQQAGALFVDDEERFTVIDLKRGRGALGASRCAFT